MTPYIFTEHNLLNRVLYLKTVFVLICIINYDIWLARGIMISEIMLVIDQVIVLLCRNWIFFFHGENQFVINKYTVVDVICFISGI